MITRRNWLLRCSILINIAVLFYVCSHVIYGDHSLQLPSSSAFMGGGGGSSGGSVAYLIQNNNGAGNGAAAPGSDRGATGGAAGAGAGLSSTNSNSNSINNNNNNNNYLSSNLIENGVNGGGDNGGQQQQQQQQDGHDSPTSLLKMIPRMEQHLQNQQRQEPSLDEAPNNNNKEENGDDSRFDLPTDAQPLANAAAAAAGQNNVVYADVINLAAGGPTTTNATNYGMELSSDDRAMENRIKSIIRCLDRDYTQETLQRGDFWVLKNYVQAEHGLLRCFETITYTTHADYTFLDNLIPLLERWMAPISIALHAPGYDYAPTINSIKYLRECAPEAHLVRQYVTFHVYFSSKHIPKNLLKHDKVLEQQFNCSTQPPFVNATDAQLYKTQKKMLYPVNVGRNIARDTAMTHFILASDIELYPSPGLVHKFLTMISRNEGELRKRTKPRVFPLSIFEVDGSVAVPPRDKTELQSLFQRGKAILFHKKLCPSCHNVPKSKEWMAANETDDLSVFYVGKRVGPHLHWEPIYIGTHSDPHYDERLSWEGKSDKMTQGYALCVLDYEFHILDNAFLVHKPGIKVLKKDPKRAMYAAKTNQLIKKIIFPELQVMYGVRKGCTIL